MAMGDFCRAGLAGGMAGAVDQIFCCVMFFRKDVFYRMFIM
jgi:hypothetical protein